MKVVMIGGVAIRCLTIGEFADRIFKKVITIRKYEEREILPPAPLRMKNTYRLYPEKMVDELVPIFTDPDKFTQGAEVTADTKREIREIFIKYQKHYAAIQQKAREQKGA